jgi:hypothetical protein
MPVIVISINPPAPRATGELKGEETGSRLHPISRTGRSGNAIRSLGCMTCLHVFGQAPRTTPGRRPLAEIKGRSGCFAGA